MMALGHMMGAGVLHAAAAAELQQRRFARLDRNDDGGIERTELLHAGKNHGRHEARVDGIFKNFDADSNEVIDTKEYEEMATQIREKIVSVIGHFKQKTELSSPTDPAVTSGTEVAAPSGSTTGISPETPLTPPTAPSEEQENVLAGLMENIHQHAKQEGGIDTLRHILGQLREQSTSYTPQGTTETPRLSILSLVDEVA